MHADGNNNLLTDGSPAETEWANSVDVVGTAAGWLASDRLMTPDIRRSFDTDVRITVLREDNVTLPNDVRDVIDNCPAEGWLREITMHVGDTLLVHALCFAPLTTCERHPWLTTLGDAPLGGQLAQLGDVSRVSKSYCRADALASDVASRAGHGAWSRRSLFDIQGEPLVLIEHLSAALTSQPRIPSDGSGKN